MQADTTDVLRNVMALMLEATRRKLDEARFFYGHIIKERQRKHFPDPPAFRYYFSAFIQAARTSISATATSAAMWLTRRGRWHHK